MALIKMLLIIIFAVFTIMFILPSIFSLLLFGAMIAVCVYLMGLALEAVQ